VLETGRPVVAIVTVIGAEFRAMRDALGMEESDGQFGDGQMRYEKILATDFNGEIRVRLHVIGEAGNVASAVDSARIATDGVCFMILGGIAAGHRDKVKIGDVIVPRAVIDRTVKAVEDGNYQARPSIAAPLKGVLQMNAAVAVDDGEWHRAFSALLGDARPEPADGQQEEFTRHVALVPALHESAVLSDNLLIRDPNELVDAANDLHQQVRVGEMEAAGFVKACITQHPPMPWYLARGVSDFGDSLKNDRFHDYACAAMASYLALYVRRVLDLRIWGIGHGGAGYRPEHFKYTPKVPEAPYWSTVRRLKESLRLRMPMLIGRERVINDIDDFLRGEVGYRLLVGGAFSGKTSLLLEVVSNTKLNADVVSYFLSERSSDADSDRFLIAVVPQLAALLAVAAPSPDRDNFAALWRQARDRAAHVRRPLLLLVDGLDEDRIPDGLPSVAHLLPTEDGRWAHILVSRRPHPDLPDDLDLSHPLRAAEKYLLSPFPGAEDVADLAKQEIDLAFRKKGDDAAQLFSLLALAGGPLSVTDLASLLDGGNTLEPSSSLMLRVHRFVTERAARSLEQVASAEGIRYQFAHATLLEHARSNFRYVHRDMIGSLNRWFSLWQGAGWPLRTPSQPGTPRYLLEAFPANLADAPEKLMTLVADGAWVDAAVQTAGVDSVLSVLRRVANIPTSGPADGDRTGTVLAARMLALVQGQAHVLRNQPPGQPGYVSRHLCLYAMQLGDDWYADAFRNRLVEAADTAVIPIGGTRRVSSRLITQLARFDGSPRVAATASGGLAVTDGLRSADSGSLVVWPEDTQAGAAELYRSSSHLRGVFGLPDGRLAFWDYSTIYMWSADGRVRKVGQQRGLLWALAATDTGYIVSADLDGRIVRWDCITFDGAGHEVGHHGSAVYALTALPGGRVVSGGRDGRILVWDIGDDQVAHYELGRHHDEVWALTALSDGRVAAGGADGRVMLWSQDRSRIPPQILGRHSGRVQAMAPLTGSRLLSGCTDGRLIVWDVEPSRSLADAFHLGQHDDAVWSTVALPGDRIVTAGEDGRVLLWDSRSLDPASRDGQAAHDREVRSVACLTDGRIAAVDDYGNLKLWKPGQHGPVQRKLGELRGESWTIVTLPEGRFITADADFGDVDLWSPDEEPPCTKVTRRKSGVWAVATLSGGRVVVAGYSAAQIRSYGPDPNKPRSLGRQSREATALTVLRDGRLVIAATTDHRSLDEGSSIWIWRSDDDVHTPILLGRCERTVADLDVLPNGKVVTVDGPDGRLLNWNTDHPGAPPIELGYHGTFVDAMVVTRAGHVVTAGRDAMLRIWNPELMRIVAEVHCDATAVAAFPADVEGFSLVVAHRGGGVTIWQ
jgi:WD40 repeat protein/nucleoside phosphorylase